MTTATTHISNACIALAILLLALTVQATEAPTPSNTNNPSLPSAPARDIVMRVCSNCHAIERVVDQRRSADEWDQLIGVMIDRGAKATDDEQEQIRAYLIKYFGQNE